ncbi:MAG: Wzz/FepE/Etk N-terminal domain-containing protein [Emcibacteraceae bacterium]|nr:Wzz/FepE/Etk N-terminal domain-containing protein [Emcibacteraceae bacterium]
MIDNQGFFNIYTMVKEVKKQWILFLLVFLTCVTISILVSFLVKPQYEAEVTLMPVSQLGENDPGNGISAVSSLLGQGSVTSDIPSWSEATIVMETRAFSRNFILSQNMMNLLIEEYGFDIKWDDLSEQEKVIQLDKIARKWIKNSIKIVKDEFTNVITFSVYFSDRDLVSEWATKYVRDINAYMKAHLAEEIDYKIDFYRDKIQQEKIADIRTSFINLLSSSIQKKALMDVREEIVLRTLDPAEVSLLKFPILILNVAIGMFLGLTIGFIIVLFNSTYQRYIELDSSK